MVPVVGLANVEGVHENVKGTVLVFVALRVVVVPAQIVAGLKISIMLTVVILTAAKPGPPPLLLYLTSTVLVGLIKPLYACCTPPQHMDCSILGYRQ